MAKQKLNFNRKTLFPGGTTEVCGIKVFIKPVNIAQISTLSSQITFLVDKLREQGITFQTFNTPDNLFKIAMMVIGDVPEILSETANIELDDIKDLPPGEALKLTKKVIEINIASKDDLLGNLTSLIEAITPEIKENLKEEKNQN